MERKEEKEVAEFVEDVSRSPQREYDHMRWKFNKARCDTKLLAAYWL